MNICIIGGSGFVGTRLIELLKQNCKYKLRNIDKNQSCFYPELTIITDVRDKEKLNTLLQEQDIVVLLAAEHRDDIYPTSLYYEVNVEGTRNVLYAMDVCGVKNIIFTSSVAIYGLNKNNPNEEHPADPFNHYGKSKWQAEVLLRDWYYKNKDEKKLSIIRPTVIFGERNRGNVYNLLKQISSGFFIKIGQCYNKKSMAYVGNIVSFLSYLIDNAQNYNVYNYIDKPDLSMNELINVVCNCLNKKTPSIRLPYVLGLICGYFFDLFSKITRKQLPLSSVRVKKFCATTQFDASKVHEIGFVPPYTLLAGLQKTISFEFNQKKTDKIVFVSE